MDRANPCTAKCQAYNAGMTYLLSSSPRTVIIAALLALPLATACFAQVVAPAAGPLVAPAQVALPEDATPAPSSRPDKAVQRIRTEDAGTRIDEVRVGGETQSITVQPKTGSKMPAYEVKPSDATKGSAPSPSTRDTNGARVWNVLKF